MTNLYTLLDEVEPAQNEQESDLDQSVQQVSEMVETMAADMDNSITLSSIAAEHAAVAETINNSLRNLPLGSKEYYACLESGKSVIDILGKRMGVTKLPAMEDFKNEYAAKTSHTLALESVLEFMKKSWEAIRAFFKEFFKKIMIFMKRIVRANLDLVSYEKYNEEMIAKLKAGHATLKDNSPIPTKLAALVADSDQELVTSDFLLRSGMLKVVTLTGVMDRIAKGDNNFFNHRVLRELRDGLEAMVTLYNKKLDSDVSKTLDAHIASVTEAATGVLSSMFGAAIPDIRSLPESVYEKLFEDFSAANLKTKSVTVVSMVDLNGFNSVLPKDTNLYLAHSEGHFSVTGYQNQNTYVKPQIEPISNVNNLIKFHDDYKRHVQRVDLNACMKTIDKYEEDVFKILDLLANKYVRLIEGQNASTDLDDTFFRNFYAALRNSGYTLSRYSNNDKLSHHLDNECAVQLLGAAVVVPTTEAELNAIGYFKDAKPEVLTRVVKHLTKVSGIDIRQVSSAKYDPEVVSNYKKLQELNRYLTQVFNKLQIIFRTLIADIMGLYTEIRYEMVRYIYESCRRYSY